MSRLPIEDILPALRETLQRRRNVVLTAPPGAGKTTVVPLALLDAAWLSDMKLLMLEPRRLAAKAAAARMASTLRQDVGATVGYRMRLDTKVGPATRIEVVTEGILTRLLQHDPSLAEYGAVLFDEFHERSLQADTGLALCLATQRMFRPELRLLVMSATLDCGSVAALLGGAETIAAEGRLFPVETRYLDRPIGGRLDDLVVRTIRQALATEPGGLLVFLPGMADIRRVERSLLEATLGPAMLIAPLHGDLPQEAQDAALAPAPPGKRKIVLATSIAETSLTIDGVRVVIDAGRMRIPRFDPRSGLTRLETVRISQDSAEQRRGRAGRLQAGVCYRLWTEREQAALAPRRSPEMLDSDLAPLLLDLAAWGTSNPAELSWLTPPPAGAIAQAKELLVRLGALDASGRMTEHGQAMSALPLHPRLAHMLIVSMRVGLTNLACRLAALLSERDLLCRATGSRNADLRLRLDILTAGRESSGSATVDSGALRRVKRMAEYYRGLVARRPMETASGLRREESACGLLLASAYPDRIAQRQAGSDGRYLLVNGRGALFADTDSLAAEPYLVIADLEGDSQWARINLAAPVSLSDIESLYEADIVERDLVAWDRETESVRASKQRRLGAIALSERALPQPDPSSIAAALVDGVRAAGLASLGWSPELQQWRARIQFLRRVEGPDSAWPNVSDDALLQTLPKWLGPFLNGLTTLDRVRRMDLTAPLHSLLTWEQQRRLERDAPTFLIVPSGSRIRVNYEPAECPVLPVRLQELFGCKETPRIADGKVPVMLHLLSPAGRPVQVTQDLAGFWARTYPEVRKELRGRYPKHHWPDDPLAALPTAKAKKSR